MKLALATVQTPALHTASQGYHAHHFICPTCVAAGLGYGERCAAGQGLWTNYLAEHDAVAAPPVADAEGVAA